MQEGFKDFIVTISVLFVLLLLMYLFIIAFSWGFLVLFFSITLYISYIQTKSIKQYGYKLSNKLSESKSLKLYCFFGILKNVFSLIVCLTFLSGSIYYALYGEVSRQLFEENFLPIHIGYLLMFLSIWGVLTIISQLWDESLTEDFDIFETLANSKIVYVGFLSLIGSIAGIFIWICFK